MLRFSNRFCTDEKAEKMVKDFYNGRLIVMVEEQFTEHANGNEKITDDNMEFAEMLEIFFPDNYPVENRVRKMKDLLELLREQEEKVPDLVMEYVLHAMIEIEVNMYELTGISTIQEIPDREYILEKLNVGGTEQDIVEEQEITAEEVLVHYEDLKNYEDYCFWDMDFALLDTYTFEEIANSKANKILGII